MSPRHYLGIDFGTTNSAVAVCDDDGRAELIPFSARAGDTSTFRSVLYFDPERRGRNGAPLPQTGPGALDSYLENLAEGHTEGRLIQSLKSYLASRTFTATQVLGRQYTLEALIALIVEGLGTAARARFPSLPRTAVVGRPVRFAGAEAPEDEAFALGRLRAAFERAGFESIAFEREDADIKLLGVACVPLQKG
jgi:hypothetical chaperone protein